MADTYMKDMVTNIKTLVEITKENIKETKKDKDKENVDEKKDRIKAERDFKKLNSEIKNPSSPMNKLYIKMMQTSLGKMTVGFLKTSSYNVKTYYGKMAAIASGLFNRMFGKILDDLRPFLDAFKATASFLINVTKDLAKGIASITLSILKFPITLTKFMYSIGSTVFNFLKPKKDTPEVKIAKKQLSVETKILRILGKQTRYLGWIEKNTASSYVTGALGARKYGRIKKAFKGGINTGTNTTGAVGSVAGAVGSVIGTAGSVIGGGLGLMGNIGGFFAKMIPYIGGVLAPLATIGIPILLGAGLLKGLWGKFEEANPEAAQWIDKKIITPLTNFWSKTIYPGLKEVASFLAKEIGSAIWKGLWEWNASDDKEQLKVLEKIAKERELTENEKLEYRRLKKVIGWGGGAVAGLRSIWGTGVEKIAPGYGFDPYNGPTGPKLDKIQSKKEGGAVPIIAHEGEYVIRKSSVDKYGPQFMDALNKGLLPHFKQGGFLGNIADLYGKLVGFPSDRAKEGSAGLTEYLSAKKPESPFYNYPKTNTAPFIEGKGQTQIQKWIDTYSKKYGVDPKLVSAVMKAESGGHHYVGNSNEVLKSSAGALGFMQLMPGTAKDLKVNPYKPEENIEGGVKYLKQQLDQFGSTELALAAYNAGPGAVLKYGRNVPPYAETQKYVKAVMGSMGKDIDTSKFSLFGGKNGIKSSDSLFGSIWDMLGSLGSLATSIFKELLTAMGMLEPETLGSKTSGSSRTGRAVASSADYLKEIPLPNSLGNDMAMRETGAYSAGAANTIIINSGGSDDRLKTPGIMPSTSQLQSLVPSI